MTSGITKYRVPFFITVFIITVSIISAQEDTDKWKFQLALGINNPIDDGKNDGYYSRYINFPSVNLGIQHMFTDKLGAKLDYGFNRAASDTGSKTFKLNYSRVNLQFVYNATNHLKFLPEALGFILHLGPGISFTQPLGNDNENTYTYLNFLAGLELHYKMSRSLTMFSDLSFAYSLTNSDRYDPIIDGFSFNGNLVYASVGISVSLSGCNYCGL